MANIFSRSFSGQSSIPSVAGARSNSACASGHRSLMDGMPVQSSSAMPFMISQGTQLATYVP